MMLIPPGLIISFQLLYLSISSNFGLPSSVTGLRHFMLATRLLNLDASYSFPMSVHGKLSILFQRKFKHHVVFPILETPATTIMSPGDIKMFWLNPKSVPSFPVGNSRDSGGVAGALTQSITLYDLSTYRYILSDFSKFSFFTS